MEKNKTGKYLKYAIGEIVLVVIGILIALQVNEWNEQRKFKSLKTTYIERLIEDLKEDKLNIASLNIKLDEKQQIIRDVISAIESDYQKDNLTNLIKSFFDSGWNMLDFVATSNTYTDLSQSGNMNVFNDAELTKSIKHYYVFIESESKGHTINKDWIIPLDVSLSRETSAFEFDPNTRELFHKKDSTEALNTLLKQRLLFERTAAGHFWFNKSMKRGLSKIDSLANTLIIKLESELSD